MTKKNKLRYKEALDIKLDFLHKQYDIINNTITPLDNVMMTDDDYRINLNIYKGKIDLSDDSWSKGLFRYKNLELINATDRGINVEEFITPLRFTGKDMVNAEKRRKELFELHEFTKEYIQIFIRDLKFS